MPEGRRVRRGSRQEPPGRRRGWRGGWGTTAAAAATAAGATATATVRPTRRNEGLGIARRLLLALGDSRLIAVGQTRVGWARRAAEPVQAPDLHDDVVVRRVARSTLERIEEFLDVFLGCLSLVDIPLRIHEGEDARHVDRLAFVRRGEAD